MGVVPQNKCEPQLTAGQSSTVSSVSAPADVLLHVKSNLSPAVSGNHTFMTSTNDVGTIYSGNYRIYETVFVFYYALVQFVC